MGLVDPIRVERLSEWQSSVRRTSSQVEARVDRLLAVAAVDVADDARRLVPRGPSGAARASLRVVGAQVTGGGGRAPYFGWLSFGGRTGIDGSVRRTFVPGGRYPWPQWLKARTDIIDAMEDGIRDLLAENSI